MTRGDFILGVLTSLIATILFELTRKFHLRLTIKPIKECGKRFLIIAIALTSLLASSFRRLTLHQVSIKVLSASIAAIVIFTALVKVPLQTVQAPSPNSAMPIVERPQPVSVPQPTRSPRKEVLASQEVVAISLGKPPTKRNKSKRYKPNRAGIIVATLLETYGKLESNGR